MTRANSTKNFSHGVAGRRQRAPSAHAGRVVVVALPNITNVYRLGHGDSITLPGMNAAQLQQVLAGVVHLH